MLYSYREYAETGRTGSRVLCDSAELKNGQQKIIIWVPTNKFIQLMPNA